MVAEILSVKESADRAGGGLKGGKLDGQGLEGARAERKVVEFSFTANCDKADCFQFLDVVGEGGGGNGQGGTGLRTAERTAGFGNALEKFEAARVGERFQNGSAARSGEACGSWSR